MRRVFTAPGFGAFAMITNVRLGEEHRVVWTEDSMESIENYVLDSSVVATGFNMPALISGQR